MTLLARTLLVFLVASAMHIPQSNAEGVPHGLVELFLTGWSKTSSEGLGCSLPGCRLHGRLHGPYPISEQLRIRMLRWDQHSRSCDALLCVQRWRN